MFLHEIVEPLLVHPGEQVEKGDEVALAGAVGTYQDVERAQREIVERADGFEASDGDAIQHDPFQPVSCVSDAAVGDMLRLVVAGLDSARQSRGKLGIDKERNLRTPQHGMIVLARREIENGGDVVRLQVGQVAQDFLTRRPRRQQVQHVCDTDAQPADAGSTAAHIRVCRDPIEIAHVASFTPAALLHYLSPAPDAAGPEKSAMLGPAALAGRASTLLDVATTAAPLLSGRR